MSTESSRHDLDGGARMLHGRLWAELSRDPARRARPARSMRRRRWPQLGHYPASTKSLGDPPHLEKRADSQVNAERPANLFAQQVWAARGHEEAIARWRGLDVPGYFNGAARGFLPPGDPHHFDRHPQALAFAKADVVVIIGTPSILKQHGKRINVPTLVQVDLGYNIVGKNRHRSRHCGRSARCARQCSRLPPAGSRTTSVRRVAKAMDGRARQGRGRSAEKLMPIFTLGSASRRSILIGWSRDQRVPHRRHDLYRRWRRRGDHLGAGGAPAQPRARDGSGRRARLASASARFAMVAKLAHPKKEVLLLHGDVPFGMTAFDM